MDKALVKTILFGTIAEMIREPKYYANFSADPRFGALTEEGKKALHEFIERITIEVAIAEKAEIERVAKELTMAALKGDKV